jgi:hypothetical protein
MERPRLPGADLCRNRSVLACFTTGYAIAMIPQNLLILRVRPRILFPINGGESEVRLCVTCTPLASD